MNEITLIDASAFAEAYPDKPAKLAMRVASPLFERKRLIALGKSLAPHLLEFNSGEVPFSTSPDAVPPSGRSFEETVLEIGERNSWVNLRNLEWDAEYRALTDECIAPLAAATTAKTGPILQRENFLFISSADAVTPAHLDEEHNILFQIEGEKVVTVYSQGDREIVPQEKLEQFHTGGHRYVTIAPEQESRGRAFHLAPGDALYIPPLAPHWVKVAGAAPSLSLSVTWRSHASKRVLYLHQINHRLRGRGARPRFPGEAPIIDTLKIWRESGARRLQSAFARAG